MSIALLTHELSNLGFEPRQLLDFNTLALSCEASSVMDLSSLEQLPALSALAGRGCQFLVLGGGSNVVLPAKLARPVLLIKLTGIRLIEQSPKALIIEASAGENWHQFVKFCVKAGWGGLENLALIPGTVGAAPVQNIGAYGVELATFLESVSAWHLPTGRHETLSAAQCAFAYRDSVFKQSPLGTWVITSVRFRLPQPWRAACSYPELANHPLVSSPAERPLTPQRIFDAVCQIRHNKLPDPTQLGNAGSFFKNPVVSLAVYERLRAQYPTIVAYPQAGDSFKLAAGWLIDQCGEKGRRKGPVGVHERQALVLVNYGGASTDELLSLANEVSAKVTERFGVELEIEPVIVSSKT
jgi:UDP-N-acetylmuramate dehydrogenase